MATDAPLPDQAPLSPRQRLELIRTLNSLPVSQFGELLFSLNPPSGVVPSDAATQGNRASSLLQWAESPTGPQWPAVLNLLHQVTGNPAFAPAPVQTGPRFLAPRRNPFFTGREGLFRQIHRVLATGEPAALSGLGGIGKTQIAAEYAHRHRDQYTDLLWVQAESEETLISTLTALAQELGLALSQDAEQAVVLQALRAWLTDTPDWLLILDNADHLDLVRPWLSLSDKGHILLTTRASETRPLAECISVMAMPSEEGALFLLRRSGQVAKGRPLTGASTEQRSRALELCQLMDGLPLALDQAGAYILETPSSLDEYLELYQTAGPQLLAQRGQNALDHPSVTITFALAIEIASQRLPILKDFIHLCAFLAPDGIPEELFTDSAAVLDEPLKSVLTSRLEFLELLKAAGHFSLIVRNVDEHTFSLHRLVQEVVRDRLERPLQEQLTRQMVEAMNEAFPAVEFAYWPLCDRLLPHGLEVMHWRQQHTIETESAGRLLNQIALYLKKRGRTSEAEPLYLQAIDLGKRCLGEDHPDVATRLNNLATLYSAQGRTSEAEPLYLQAIDLGKRCLGEDHPDVATRLNNLATLYSAQGRTSEAEPLYLQALEITKRRLGEDHPDVATRLNNLANLYSDQGRYNEAKPLYSKALDMRKRLLGEGHPHTTIVRNNCESLQRAMNQKLK